MKRNNRGFTLIEMAVVLVLIGILSATFVPSMEIVYKQEIRKAADIICADLVGLRKQAIANNLDYMFIVDGGKKYNYTISPSIIQGDERMRGNNKQDGISRNIIYSIMAKYNDGTQVAANAIFYKKGKLVDATSKQIDQLIIRVVYSGTSQYAEIFFETFTGRYSITFKS